jgi:hypothetical protein
MNGRCMSETQFSNSYSKNWSSPKRCSHFVPFWLESSFDGVGDVFISLWLPSFVYLRILRGPLRIYNFFQLVNYCGRLIAFTRTLIYFKHILLLKADMLDVRISLTRSPYSNIAFRCNLNDLFDSNYLRIDKLVDDASFWSFWFKFYWSY